MTDGPSTPEQPTKGLRELINRAKEIQKIKSVSSGEAVARAAHEREKKRREEAEENATIDTLTKLPNRRAFESELEERISEKNRTGEDFYLGFIDIDEFKRFNSAFTHKGGDDLLRLFKILDQFSRPREGLYRLAGDEIVQFIQAKGKEEENEEMLVDLAERNQELYSELSKTTIVGLTPDENFTGEEIPKASSISYGFVRYQEGMSAETLLELSSTALLRAKREDNHISIVHDSSENLTSGTDT